jgi:hypothetical protein
MEQRAERRRRARVHFADGSMMMFDKTVDKKGGKA